MRWVGFLLFVSFPEVGKKAEGLPVQALQNFSVINYKLLIFVNALTACAFHVSAFDPFITKLRQNY